MNIIWVSDKECGFLLLTLLISRRLAYLPKEVVCSDSNSFLAFFECCRQSAWFASVVVQDHKCGFSFCHQHFFFVNLVVLYKRSTAYLNHPCVYRERITPVNVLKKENSKKENSCFAPNKSTTITNIQLYKTGSVFWCIVGSGVGYVFLTSKYCKDSI